MRLPAGTAASRSGSGKAPAGRRGGGRSAGAGHLSLRSAAGTVTAVTKPPRRFSAIFLVPTAAVGLLALLGFAGRWWWQFDLLAHFRPQYGVILLIGGLGLAATRRTRPAVVALLLAVLNLALVAPLYTGRPAPHDTTLDELTVLTFNVQASQPGRADVVRWLGTVNADVIFLNEASTDWEADLLAADLPYTLAFPRRPGNVFGTAVLFKGAGQVRAIRLGDNQQDVIELTMRHDGREVVLYGSHSLSPTTKQRSAARDDQLASVERRILDSGRPGVMVGDFNATPWSHSFPRSLVNSGEGFGLQPTWRTGWEPLTIPIDHLLHTPDLTTVDRRVLPDQGSDHYPLLITLAWVDS